MANETILVVDDSPEIARVLDEYMLTPWGYDVLYAPNGQLGLDQTIEQCPDLIILDLNMPQMSGMEMLLALRETDCKAPVIIMTMHGSESVAVEAFRLGVCNYLIKPFTPEEVRTAVDDALQSLRLAQEKEALNRSIIATETVRQTTVTLAHYINNYLMTLVSGLSLLEDELQTPPTNINELLDLIRNGRESTMKIEAVLRVLQRVTNVQERTYHGQVTMIDVEEALQKELARLQEK